MNHDATAHPQASQNSAIPERMNAPATGFSRNRRRRMGLGLALILSVAAVTAGAIHWNRSRTPPPPLVELTDLDPAVAAAVERARALVLRTPQSGAAWGQLGRVLAAHRIDREAWHCFEQAGELDPRNPRWPYLQARLGLDDAAETLRKLDRAIALCSEDMQVPRLRRGETLLTLGRIDAAEQQFRDVLSRSGSDLRARLGLARVLFQRRRLDEAAAEVAPALVDTHARKAAHQLLAEIELRRSHREAAAEALQTAARLPEDTPWPDPFMEEIARQRIGRNAVLKRAAQMIAAEKYTDAVALLRKTLQNYPDAHHGWLLLSKALRGVNQIAEAERAVRTSLSLYPDSSDAQYQLGVMLLMQGHLEAATTAFQEAAHLRPDFAWAHFMLGQCRLQADDEARAVEEFREALRCRPDFGEGLAALGELLIKQGEREQGLDLLRQAAAVSPNDPTIRQMLEQAEHEPRSDAP